MQIIIASNHSQNDVDKNNRKYILTYTNGPNGIAAV